MIFKLSQPHGAVLTKHPDIKIAVAANKNNAFPGILSTRSAGEVKTRNVVQARAPNEITKTTAGCQANPILQMRNRQRPMASRALAPITLKTMILFER